MGFFTPILLCILLIAILFGFARLFLFLSNRLALRSVYESGLYTPKTVHTMLLAEFHGKHLISGKLFPRKTEKGAVYEQCDHILVTDSTVFVITICPKEGKVQNLTSSETWKISVRTKSGERERAFENPVMAGKRKQDAISFLLEKAKFPFAVPVKQVVIFPSRRVQFLTERQKEIQSPPEAMRTFRTAHAKKKFSKEQKKRIIDCLRRRGKTEAWVASKTAKRRHR